ncbi:formate dehydrogenase accessory sulfurtransferase FdhD [Microvirga thermotolerans]|uniref:Sulfur carrier protein FdhD n=1 Tax=Microvirga thermotolerans TaxID=2651334 RepID=A0A5P9K0C6_9HYPH|nr:formate dehydrogenase accessory sulfurtransferase FdhD [Microvirga thermotolerans]
MRRSDLAPVPDVAADEAATVFPYDGGEPASTHRELAVEEPVSIVYAGIPFAVMMASPADLEDFAVGFSLTEGIIESAGDIVSIRMEKEERGLRLLIDLSAQRLHAHLARRRALAGRTGCGLCGIDDFDALPKPRPPAGSAPVLPVSAVRRALAALEGRQPLNERTRAVHAAAWASLAGDLLLVREDVGRHNALDKLIGALCRENARPQDGFVVVTSRCSFELVEKVAAFGARTIVAISAPTSLALARARIHDITLVAIARHDSMTVFHGIDRILARDVPA